MNVAVALIAREVGPTLHPAAPSWSPRECRHQPIGLGSHLPSGSPCRDREASDPGQNEFAEVLTVGNDCGSNENNRGAQAIRGDHPDDVAIAVWDADGGRFRNAEGAVCRRRSHCRAPPPTETCALELRPFFLPGRATVAAVRKASATQPRLIQTTGVFSAGAIRGR
jgi:hypothetical protein